MPSVRPTPEDLAPFLAKDETVLWSGQPPTGVLFRGTDFFAIPFSMLWAGFVIFWNVTLWLALATGLSKSGASSAALMRFATTDAPSVADAIVGLAMLALFLGVGLIFLGVGYYVLIGRFVADAQSRARTLYAVTNYRALLAESGGRRLKEVRGYELTLGGEVSVAQHRRNFGSITFGQPDPWFGNAQQHLAAFVFERIPQVRDVARIVEDVRRPTR